MPLSFKHNLLALSLISALTTLTACNDGKDGTQGPAGVDAPTGLDMNLVGRVQLNASSPEGAAEIVAYQASKHWIYAINSSGSHPTVEIMSAENMVPSALTANGEGIITNTNLDIIYSLNLSLHTTGDANSIAISDSNELLAVAIAAHGANDKGSIAFYDISGAIPVFLKNVEVGVLPDMVTFTHEGLKVVVANEGQPNGDYTVDPEGSISVIGVNNGLPEDTATEINFKAFNNQKAHLQAQGMVFPNPTGRTINGVTIDTTVAMDLEPEYISISPDDQIAYVSLQENNGLAIVDLSNNSVQLQGLGFKDWSKFSLDASDKDGGIHFQTYRNLYGMYQPDTIASYSWHGAHFVVTANEGDSREYFFDSADEQDCLDAGGLEFDEDDGCLSYSDEVRVKDLNLGAAFDGLNKDNSDIGRLKVSRELGDEVTPGTYDKLYAYGARSFSIFDQTGQLVFDSGDEIGRITAAVHGKAFNNDEDVNKGDSRSDDKGAEPEALALGTIGSQTYAFIGLERMSGILVYDVTNPFQVTFIDYFHNRGSVEGEEASGDLAPEGMKFVPALHSPTGKSLLIVGNEISGTVAVWQITQK